MKPVAAQQAEGSGGLAASWDAFCERLRSAGHETLSAVDDQTDAAEGLLQFGMLLEVALRWYLRGADTDHPRFIEINDTPEIADNLFAAVRGDAIYQITGNVSTLFDFNLSIHSSWVWLKPSLPTGDAGLSNFEVDADGSIEIILGGEPRPGNWLPLPPDAQFIQLREYHCDFGSHRPGLWNIVRTGTEECSPTRMSPSDVAERLESALSWAERYGSFHRASIQSGRTFPAEPNSINPPAVNKGGNKHIWYGFGRFALHDDEALILEFPRPEARLWSVQWLTDPWYENPDLLTRLTGLPGTEAHVDSDDRVRVVLSARDPGIGNWLDVSGYPSGLFVTRWVWCAEGPGVGLKVVPLTELRNHLPAETPAIDAAQRAAQVARRRAHFVHRRR
jgi:hypothetical protein